MCFSFTRPYLADASQEQAAQLVKAQSVDKARQGNLLQLGERAEIVTALPEPDMTIARTCKAKKGKGDFSQMRGKKAVAKG